MKHSPTGTLRFYVSFSWAGTWAVEPLQSLPLGLPIDPEDLADALRQLADRVEGARVFPPIVYLQQ